METKNETLDLGNNESVSRGVFEGPDGFLAMTYTKSKMFKTRKGAEAWLRKREWIASLGR
jgi:hypothetical protein